MSAPNTFTLQLELGRSWSVARLERLLTAAAVIEDGNQRMWFLAGHFLADNTPCELESTLPEPPEGTLRVRLETLDCITFIYYLVALCHATTFDGFITNLARIRHAGVPAPQTLRHYTDNVVAEMIRFGMVEDITASLVPAACLATRTVRRLGVTGEGRLFLGDERGIRGDLNLGESLTTRFIPTAHVEEAEPALRNGDVLLMVTARDPDEYPSMIQHGAIAFRKPGRREAYIVHCGRSKLGRPDGPSAGVSMLTYYDEVNKHLIDDGVHRPLHRYLRDPPPLKQGVIVLRPSNGRNERD